MVATARSGVFFALLLLGLIVAIAMPASAQQPTSVNPTAQSVQEQQLLKELNKNSRTEFAG